MNGGKKNKRGGSQLEPLVLGGGNSAEFPDAYGAAAQAGGSVFPVSAAGGGSRRRKGRAGGSKKRKSKSRKSKSRKSKKRGSKSRKH